MAPYYNQRHDRNHSFWFAVKNATEDRRYNTLMKRYGDMEEDHEKRISSYESKLETADKKGDELKEKLESADDERRTLRHSLRNLQNEIGMMKILWEKTGSPFPFDETSTVPGVDSSPSGVVTATSLPAPVTETNP